MTYPGPAPALESYGTEEGVAALANTWTRAGAWFDQDVYVEATNPSLTTVVTWIDQVSGMLNTALAGYGFVVPLTKKNSVLAATSVVEGIVGDLARYVNQKGRFFSDKFQGGASVWSQIREDLSIWVKEYAPGLEANGETRSASNVYAVGSRGFDADGHEIFPIFQREGFGNRFENWTKKK
jgi:hypothetical protein